MSVYLEMDTRFWRITVKGAAINMAYGKIGTTGQTTTIDHADAAKASASVAKKIAEKRKKGYADAADPSGGGSAKRKKKTAAGAAKAAPASKKAKKTAAGAAAKAAPAKAAAAASKKAKKKPVATSKKAGLSGKVAAVGGDNSDEDEEAIAKPDPGIEALNKAAFKSATGSSGQAQLDGPFTEADAAANFKQLFTKKCGQNKPSDEVEELYQTYHVDGNTSMSVRYVFAEAVNFTYRVDLTNYTQTNTRSGTARTIRRV
eukprot:gene1287-8168_t